jgi:hypothetical protein
MGEDNNSWGFLNVHYCGTTWYGTSGLIARVARLKSRIDHLTRSPGLIARVARLKSRIDHLTRCRIDHLTWFRDLNG